MRKIILLASAFVLSACSSTEKKIDHSQWDFDHHVRFEQKVISNNSYQVTVLRNNDTHFAQMSMFILRHAKTICSGKAYQLEIIQGVEDFDDRRVAKSYILPSMIANITCQNEQK